MEGDYTARLRSVSLYLHKNLNLAVNTVPSELASKGYHVNLLKEIARVQNSGLYHYSELPFMMEVHISTSSWSLFRRFLLLSWSCWHFMDDGLSRTKQQPSYLVGVTPVVKPESFIWSGNPRNNCLGTPEEGRMPGPVKGDSRKLWVGFNLGGLMLHQAWAA